MKDTSSIRPQAITVEQLEGGKARVSLCTDIVESQTDEGTAVFTFNRFSTETVFTPDLEDRVATAAEKWIKKLQANETAQRAKEVRVQRDKLLTDSDAEMTIDRALHLELPERITATTMLTVIKDLFDSLSDVFNGAWAAYRKQLRDLPQQPGFPWNVEWPERPE